ncbi:MAG: hypothetical protein JWM57_902 [Phycisphaerales bacterium]|nr:hypothetical protein [Phycisphaerales bacterium]
MQKWFLFGIFFAAFCIFVPGYVILFFFVLHPPQADVAVANLLLTFVGIAGLALWAGSHVQLNIQVEQRQRPHKLFKPYYDQR